MADTTIIDCGGICPGGERDECRRVCTWAGLCSVCGESFDVHTHDTVLICAQALPTDNDGNEDL